MKLVNAFFLLWLVLFPISPAFAVLIGSKVGFDNATNFSIIAQHGPILAEHPDMLNAVSPSNFWEYKIQFNNTEKPGIASPRNDIKQSACLFESKCSRRYQRIAQLSRIKRPDHIVLLTIERILHFYRN